MNFRFVTHLDTFAVTAALHKRLPLFGEGIKARHEGHPGLPVRSLLLRGPREATTETWTDDLPCEDFPALDKWPSMRRLLEQARVALGPDLQMGRAMISALLPHSVIAWHIDSGVYHDRHFRAHVPLVTNPLARLYAGPEMMHLPVGSLWWFNNKATHTAANWGAEKRYHLIVDFRLPEKPA